jgi:hypothetical protein
MFRYFGKAHILIFSSQEQTEFTEFITLPVLFLVSLSSVKGHQTAKGNIHPHANFQRSYAKGKTKICCQHFIFDGTAMVDSSLLFQKRLQ